MTKTGCPGLMAWIYLLVFMFLVGCGGSPAEFKPAGDQQINVTAVASGGLLTDAIVPVSRLATDTSSDFVSNRDGNGFAADLPLNLCSAEGAAALLDPAWQLESPNSLDNAAYCIYRLRLYQTLEDATLTIEWEGEAPASGTCWLGLPDWQRMCWSWQLLPESNAVDLAEPAQYANSEDHCYAVVMLLDSTARRLAAIGFGDIDPPEPPAQYNLFDPLYDYNAYLVDMEGNLVHSWTTARLPATCSYLLENGHLLRPGNDPDAQFHGSGCGGIIEELDWDSNVVWSFAHSNATEVMHHDIEPLPNGNILAIVWERKTREELLQAGRRPGLIPFGNSMILDSIIEIEPAAVGGKVVWEWHLWDHLIQEFDPAKDNYGVVSEHPELVDFNYPATRAEDYSHFNAVAYNAELDQIAVTASILNEIWLIDHSTTTAEAASHNGGNSGHGGDLLYRWGNPEAYGAGAVADRRLFGGHNVQWIPAGAPGAGHLLVFNNGSGRPDGNYSSVDEIETPLEPDGKYYLEEGQAYAPTAAAWSYMSASPTEFYSWYISGAQRLPSGNTVVCSGANGWFFEVTPAGEVVWEYNNPYTLMGSYAVFRMTRLFGDYADLANRLPEGE